MIFCRGLDASPLYLMEIRSGSCGSLCASTCTVNRPRQHACDLINSWRNRVLPIISIYFVTQ